VKPPEAKPEPPPAPPEEPTVRIPDKPEPKPEPPKPEAKKPEPKPEPPKPEAKKPEPKPEPPKAEVKKLEPPKPPAKPAEAPKPAAAQPGSPAGTDEAPRDAYGAAAERWRQRSGGGLGGKEGGSGPIGAGAEGKGGGGQLVGLEFMAYRQQVINTIKSQWANVIARPGLVAAVRFEIAPDGEVSGVRLAQSSGNPAYDASAMRAVQHVGKLPAPPARYASEFSEFVIEFHSEESGGQGAG
jgi:TonB family protein